MKRHGIRYQVSVYLLSMLPTMLHLYHPHPHPTPQKKEENVASTSSVGSQNGQT